MKPCYQPLYRCAASRSTAVGEIILMRPTIPPARFTDQVMQQWWAATCSVYPHSVALGTVGLHRVSVGACGGYRSRGSPAAGSGGGGPG